jgi:predicted nucleic-acid-binding protein
MKIVADTNVLLRAVVGDEPEQSRLAREALSSAELVILGPHALCELVWVLRSRYHAQRADIAAMLQRLCEAKNVAIDSAAVKAGMAMLEAGSDFADGVIAYEGQRLGGETFVSFDKQAVAALKKQGVKAQLIA